jgi:exosortase/archaeosortase family protein
VVVICILVALFYAFQWNFLRHFFTFLLQKIFTISGTSTIFSLQNGDSYLFVKENPFNITAACTYIDLVLIIIPLIWRIQRSLIRNLSMIIVVVCLILALNVLRIWGTIYFYLAGVSWESIHHIPDVIIHVIIITVCVIFALKADLILPVKNQHTPPAQK